MVGALTSRNLAHVSCSTTISKQQVAKYLPAHHSVCLYVHRQSGRCISNSPLWLPLEGRAEGRRMKIFLVCLATRLYCLRGLKLSDKERKHAAQASPPLAISPDDTPVYRDLPLESHGTLYFIIILITLHYHLLIAPFSLRGKREACVRPAASSKST